LAERERRAAERHLAWSPARSGVVLAAGGDVRFRDVAAEVVHDQHMSAQVGGDPVWRSPEESHF
jgi:hypothetical protein